MPIYVEDRQPIKLLHNLLAIFVTDSYCPIIIRHGEQTLQG